VLSHVIQECPGGPFLFSGGRGIRIILACASSSIRAMCPSMERRRDWIIAVKLGCLVIHISSLQTNWCRVIWFQAVLFKHHWSRASILHATAFVIAQHSDAYRKIGRIQVLYNFSFVGIETRDIQKWLSVLCIAAWVIALRCMMSGVLCVDEWTTEPRYTNWSTTATCWSWTVMVGGTFTLVPKAWTFLSASSPQTLAKST